MSCPSETRLQAFIEGDLSPTEISELSSHLDTCVACRTLVGVVQPVPLDDDTETDRVGRYVLRRVLGRGGMGVVYEAVDPELHRVVALKVLRSDLGAKQERLLAEAQAMAMLSHPNVVSIYDVGRAGQRVFIVMELVVGVSLSFWLSREPRSLGAILDAFEQAAEGLRAAHDAGLVHRDFKPENVFVAKDGRVLVGDFGLARSVDTEAREAEGSLAYMAPEQRSGKKVDARSDLYSFCLALREALRGVPVVPRWLSKLIERGARSDPADRFASMRDLLAALRAGRRGARRRRLLVLGSAALALVLAFATGGVFWLRARDTPDLVACRAREAEMAALWGPAAATKTEVAFRDTKSPLAEGAWSKASAVLGEYKAAWERAHARTCEAPRPRREDEAALLQRKTNCLAERLEIVRAVTANLAQVDAAMLEQVPALLQLLPRVSACEDTRELAELAPPPSADKLAVVDRAKKKIAGAAAAVAAGRYKEGLGLAEDALGAASAASYLPVLAEAYLWVGTAHGRLGHGPDAEKALEHAASSASAGRAPAIAVRAWIKLMHFVGFEGKRYDDGSRYGEYAKAALESMPGAHELEVERLSWLRAMLLDQKRYDEALVISRQELALVDLRLGGSHRLAAAALDGLAGVLVGQCKSRDAIEPQEKACALLEKEFGSPHPQLALCLGNLAALHANLGDHPRAVDIKARALAMFERVPGHPNHVALAHRNMVRSLLELDRLSDAKAELEAAAKLSQRASDELRIILLRGELHRREGKAAEAVTDHQLAVTKTRSDEPARRLEPLLALAESNLEAGRFAEASASAEEAAAIAMRTFGARSCRIAEPLRVQADALVALGRAGEALALAERALAASESAQIDPLARARIQFAVARGLSASERERASQLALAAHEVAATSARGKKLVARIDAWRGSQR